MWLHGEPRPHRHEHVRAVDVRLAARHGLGGPSASCASTCCAAWGRASSSRRSPTCSCVVGVPSGSTDPDGGRIGRDLRVMLAYSLTWPDRTIMLIFPPVAFRAIWLIPVAVPHDAHLPGRRQHQPRRAPGRRARRLALPAPPAARGTCCLRSQTAPLAPLQDAPAAQGRAPEEEGWSRRNDHDDRTLH